MNFFWCDGNCVELLINGEEYFLCLFQCIVEVCWEIFLEIFIIFEDEVGWQLQEVFSVVVECGVEVQVMVDGYGIVLFSMDYLVRLIVVGVCVYLFDLCLCLFGMCINLFCWLYCKLVVIDCQQVFVGGINYGEDYLVCCGNMVKQDYVVCVEGLVVCDICQVCLVLFELDVDYLLLWLLGVGQLVWVCLVICDNDQFSDDIECEYL